MCEQIWSTYSLINWPHLSNDQTVDVVSVYQCMHAACSFLSFTSACSPAAFVFCLVAYGHVSLFPCLSGLQVYHVYMYLCNFLHKTIPRTLLNHGVKWISSALYKTDGFLLGGLLLCQSKNKRDTIISLDVAEQHTEHKKTPQHLWC